MGLVWIRSHAPCKRSVQRRAEKRHGSFHIRSQREAIGSQTSRQGVCIGEPMPFLQSMQPNLWVLGRLSRHTQCLHRLVTILALLFFGPLLSGFPFDTSLTNIIVPTFLEPFGILHWFPHPHSHNLTRISYSFLICRQLLRSHCFSNVFS